MLVTRRRLVASSAAWLASASAAAAALRPFFRGHRLPIGLQLYSVAAELRADFEGTLKAVADIGYSTVETAGYVGRSAQALRAAFDAHGLACTSVHVPVRENGAEPSLSGDLGKLAADLHALGARHAVMSLFQFPERLSQPARAGESGLDRLARLSAELTLDDWRANAQFLNRVGAGLQREGLQLAYHNHNPEFAPLAGQNGLELLLRETDPALVQFEMDAGWVVAAGHDPIELLRRHPGRFRLLHVKDVAPGVQPNYGFRVRTTSVGQGIIDWKRLLPAAYAEGVREFFVEHEPPFVRPALEMVGESYRNLAAIPAEPPR